MQIRYAGDAARGTGSAQKSARKERKECRRTKIFVEEIE
jgi:hypothetical protein